jgi:hypothetical protein
VCEFPVEGFEVEVKQAVLSLYPSSWFELQGCFLISVASLMMRGMVGLNAICDFFYIQVGIQRN